MSDETDNDNEPNAGRGEGKISPPPIHTFAFWLIIICCLPLGLWLIRGQNDQNSLKQSEFERALLEKRIETLLVKNDPASGSCRILGELKADDGGTTKFVAEVTYSERLDLLIQENCDSYETKPASSWVGQLLFSVVPILLIIGIIYFLFIRLNRNVGRGAMQFGKSRARLVQSLEKVTFNDVAGIEEAKEEVVEIIEYLRNPDKFHRLGGRIPRGVLLIGPPGTGKTLLARAIAGEADVPFFNISGSDFVEMFVGVGASRVRDMFEQGKKHAPCIVFIDEIDAVGRSRFSGIGGSHDEREQTLNALLVEMDGFEAKSGVIVLSATNRPDVLDPALLRPGRFDRQIAIVLPDVKGRREILDVHAKKIKLSDGAELEITARGTPGFSGADLENLVNEAALIAAGRDKDAVDMDDLEEARDKVRWGKERRSRVMDEHDREVTAYHEAGHALVGLYCEHATPLHKVTIIPRGNAYLGAAMYLPEGDKYTQTRSELIDELTVAMGGRCAEELMFAEITNGAAGDIKMGTDLARRMVCEWGMSDKMGMLHLGERGEHIYLGRDISRTIDFSETTAREIDQEVRMLVDQASQRAKDMLTKYKDQLGLLGSALLERETMDAQEIRELLGLAPDADAEKPQAADKEVQAEDNEQ